MPYRILYDPLPSHIIFTPYCAKPCVRCLMGRSKEYQFWRLVSAGGVRTSDLSVARRTSLNIMPWRWHLSWEEEEKRLLFHNNIIKMINFGKNRINTSRFLYENSELKMIKKTHYLFCCFMSEIISHASPWLLVKSVAKWNPIVLSWFHVQNVKHENVNHMTVHHYVHLPLSKIRRYHKEFKKTLQMIFWWILVRPNVRQRL